MNRKMNTGIKKYLYAIAILLCCPYVTAQNTNANEFIAELLSAHSRYFKNALLNDNGMFEIHANEDIYAAMDSSKKSEMFETALKKWDGDMFYVHSGYRREIWKKDIRTGTVSPVGNWDLNRLEIYTNMCLKRCRPPSAIHGSFMPADL
ncbi:MAG: hypothetical protein LBI03_08345 [Clostridiales bacterium]|jgi:hypothetical protein|nr:hypothetical protein [Clostridiales bacterium]